MEEKQVGQISPQILRTRCAINTFKHCVLGDKHVPRVHQTQAILNSVPEWVQMCSIFDKSWKSWFSAEHPKIPQAGKIDILDELSSSFPQLGLIANGYDETVPENFFGDMVRGGLMKLLLKPTQSDNPLSILIGRANAYEPISALHLHLDAIDVAARNTDARDVPWDIIVAVAATRLLELLAERWGPRSGYVYKRFISDFKLRWDVADQNGKDEIRTYWKRCRPDPFDRLMQAGATPNWEKVGIKSDIAPIHIYKLLFALAADPQFLVAERLRVWSLDLATAALAMHALAWIDRYRTMALGKPAELFYWAAFWEIFFCDDPLEDEKREIGLAMLQSDAQWGGGSFRLFVEAREIYRTILEAAGISPNEVYALVRYVRDVAHPLAFEPVRQGIGGDPSGHSS